MKKILTALLATVFTAPLHAADVENGADLHFENCTGCHQSEVYTRSDRRVTSLDLLGPKSIKEKENVIKRIRQI